jgi:CyaY protein
MALDTALFDKIAEAELKALDQALGDFDPDELEAEPTPGVLSLTLGSGDKIIINSHRAAGEIWMAAFRTAWHFAPHDEGGVWVWRTAKDELRATLGRILTEKLGRAVTL